MVAKIQADEISSIIKERIDNFELSVDINETGKIVSYADGVAYSLVLFSRLGKILSKNGEYCLN